MKKRYSQHGSHAGSISGLNQISKNVYLYSGFTIRKTPRNVFSKSNAYLIHKQSNDTESGNYYGRDFALAEAMQTIDRIVRNVE
ncbi:DUF4761 family protein [Enterobacter hormaechei]|uniref:DUF4761 family protein n=1 Tax=Enterobacter hormaechei TaxID=158836 RepID=UPI000F88C25B|nr:DUF4761 family protein [Enterobacter hormaechei]RTP02476.1 DUF4761 family protein [Enterobacter hormaechei]